MPKAIKNTVGHQLNKLRTQKGLSQAELAAICKNSGWNMSREVIARIEARLRCVTDFELLLLAEVLNVQVIHLLPSESEWLEERMEFVKSRS